MAIPHRVDTLARRWIGALATLTGTALLGACAGTTTAPAGAGPLSIAEQGSFFVGGSDRASNTLSDVPGFAPVGTVSVDQMYVRYQVPEKSSGPPLVFVHGCCLTGKTWESTPDGRMGWDEAFLRRGHPTYVVDQAARGRSAADPSPIVAVKLGQQTPHSLPVIFSAGRESAWSIFRFGPHYPKAFDGMRYPLEAQGQLWKQMVPDLSRALPTPNPTVAALSQLSARLGLAVLVSHSQSGPYPFQVVTQDRTGVAGIVSIEPVSCPSPDSDMQPYARLPILVLWGDYTADSPFWAPRVKACADFVKAANAAGARARQVMLADEGMPGQTHMLMQDRNSLQIADWLAAWMRGHWPR